MGAVFKMVDKTKNIVKKNITKDKTSKNKSKKQSHPILDGSVIRIC
jgi:hypothetical protein